MTMSAPPRKPTLRALCLRHSLDVLMLWHESGVDPLTVWDALSDDATITAQVASQLLSVLNARQGTQYTLNDISVRLVEAQKERGG